MLKETAITYFKVIFRHSYRGMKEGHENMCRENWTQRTWDVQDRMLRCWNLHSDRK